MDAVVLTCGGASWPGNTAARARRARRAVPAVSRVVAVPARPGRAELADVLDGLAGRRLVVCGSDADLAAVVLRLLRASLLGSVVVGYLPSSGRRSVVARLWRLPLSPAAVVAAAARGVPLVRDDAGGVLVGRGVVRAVDGVAYCDDSLLLRGRAARVEVRPHPSAGLVARVVPGRLALRRRVVTGRAVQFGLAPTEVLRDGVADRTRDRWTWYRHTEDLHLAGAQL